MLGPTNTYRGATPLLRRGQSQHVRSSTNTSLGLYTPAQRWGNATEQARQIVRASLAEQNLPGLSVAVGAGGEVVWAEGFGWADLEKKVPVSPDLLFRIGTASTEAAADVPFLSFMRKQVYQATFYFPRFGGDPRYGPDVMRPLNYSCYSGASAFLSTPTDMVRFAMAINSGKQTRVIGHDGDSLGGMVTSLLTFPEHGLVVAVTSNISYADTHGIGVKIDDAFASGTMAK